MTNGCIELSVGAVERGVGQVVDDDIRIDSVSFDQPGTFRPVYSELGGRRDSAVGQSIG